MNQIKRHSRLGNNTTKKDVMIGVVWSLVLDLYVDIGSREHVGEVIFLDGGEPGTLKRRHDETREKRHADAVVVSPGMAYVHGKMVHDALRATVH